MIEKRILITNLWYVTIDDALRTNCNALLLAREDDPNNRGAYRCELRGFGTEAAWAVFGLTIPTIDHELRVNKLVLLRADGRPLQNAPEIDLARDDVDKPLDVQVFEWDSDDNERGHRYGAIWCALEESVARHWHAPYMPRLVHMAPAEARALPSRAGWATR